MIMRLTSKEVALTTPSRIANNSASRAVARPAGALDDDTCSPSLQKWATETACMFLGGITLASVATTSVDGSEEHALHLSYNAAANHSVELSILDDVPYLVPRPWVSFSMLEMSEALKVCSNVSAPGPDYITWHYLKSILANDICASGILSLTNSCITLWYWPQHFKESVSVIISKPGKPAYNTPKAFRPIVLLNTLGKLIEKMIARRLQFDAVKHSVLYLNQLSDIAQRSTEDAGLFLTHLVCSGWAKGLKTSVIAFDIA